jgi:hypothetical protein
VALKGVDHIRRFYWDFRSQRLNKASGHDQGSFPTYTNANTTNRAGAGTCRDPDAILRADFAMTTVRTLVADTDDI